MLVILSTGKESRAILLTWKNSSPLDLSMKNSTYILGFSASFLQLYPFLHFVNAICVRRSQSNTKWTHSHNSPLQRASSHCQPRGVEAMLNCFITLRFINMHYFSDWTCLCRSTISQYSIYSKQVTKNFKTDVFFTSKQNAKFLKLAYWNIFWRCSLQMNEDSRIEPI